MNNIRNFQAHPIELPKSSPEDPVTQLSSPRITINPETLRTFNTNQTIHRFDFPDVALQAAFHRSFALLHTQFMQHFYDKYDGQVSIPKVPARCDTSNDEVLAKTLTEEEKMVEMEENKVNARILEADATPPVSNNDFELARVMQEETPLPDMGRDAQMAQTLQNEIPFPNTYRDADIA
jgi:hypothetical protein